MNDVLERAQNLLIEKNDGTAARALALLPELVAECERLRQYCIYDPSGKIFVPEGHPELVRLRAECERLQANQCYPGQCNECIELEESLCGAKKELARWQKIAAKAAATAALAIEATDIDWYQMIDDDDIQRAAKELGIAISDHGDKMIEEARE